MSELEKKHHAWQSAKALAVKHSWESSDKKAFWKAQLDEIKAEHTYELATLQESFEEVKATFESVKNFLWEKIEKQDKVIELLLETHAILLRKARLETKEK